MSHYFRVLFKNNDDIYIVRVDGYPWRLAKAIAESKIRKQLHDVKDFEIKEVTLSNLLNMFHFINGIAQITLVTHP